MSNTVSVRTGHTSLPIQAMLGSLITISSLPNRPGTGFVEYSLNTLTDVQNNSAVWVTWPKGSVTVTTSDTAGCPILVRVGCTSGAWNMTVGDATTTTFLNNVLMPWKSANATLSVSGGSVGGVINPISGATISFGAGATTTLVSSSRSLATGDNGNTLELGSGVNLTVPTGLGTGFAVNVIPNGSHSLISSGGTLLNGATATLTRSGSGGAGIFQVIGLASVANSYDVTPTNTGTYAQMIASPAVAGSNWIVTDIGPANSRWTYNTIWRPEGGQVLLYNVPSDVIGSTAAADQIMAQFAVPANLMQKDGDTLEMRVCAGKNGTSETLTWRIRLGVLGTTSDTELLNDNRATSTFFSVGELIDFRRVSATSIKKTGNSPTNGSWAGASTFALATATTVSNFNLDMICSFILGKSSTVEIPLLQTWRVVFVAAS